MGYKAVKMLSPEQLKQREGKLTASRIGILMSGVSERVLFLWKEMLGLVGPEDLSGVWPVRLGEATEKVNLDWGERTLGPITRRGEVVCLGDPDWLAATLDGWIDKRDCPIEAKHCGGREPLDTIIARYNPQCHWQMLATSASECALSVIMGANAPIVAFIPYDKGYAKILYERAEEFMRCIENLTPPVTLPKVEPPPLPTKEYDMTGEPVWQQHAAIWIQSYGAAQTAKEAEKALKACVPDDAKSCFGHGVVIIRNRAGSMSLKELRA
jgi:hypothetical protein